MKNIRRISKDEGVSPVIATILMVAITVVLAAVLYVIVSGMMGNQQTQKIIGLTCSKIAGTSNYKCAMVNADPAVDFPNVGLQVLKSDGTIVGSLAKGFTLSAGGSASLIGLAAPLNTTAGSSKVVDNGDAKLGIGDDIYLIAAANQSLVGLSVKLSGGGEGATTIS